LDGDESKTIVVVTDSTGCYVGFCDISRYEELPSIEIHPK